MKPVFCLAALAVALLTTGFGYYLGRHSSAVIESAVMESAVIASADTAAATTASSARKILYYRNPMGLADTSPVPKLDSMGMDYLPVYENELQQTDTLVIDSHKIQTLGVQTQAVAQQLIGRDIRALGTLAINESALSDITPRFAGWITDLQVSTEGQKIAKGEILFNATIPNLYYAEVAYKQAVKRTLEVATAAPELQRQAELQMLAAMERLDEIGAPLDEIERLQRGGDPSPQIPYRSPASGVVLEKTAVQGAGFAAGDRLYRVADLGKLWLKIQLPEQQLGQIKRGDPVRVEILAEAGKYRSTQVDFIYPTLDESTRSLQLRAVLDNADYALKPGQSAEVWLQAKPHKALAIPSSALLDSGQQQWVLLALSPGVYQPRQVQLGERNQAWIEVVAGLSEGEQVVTHATFLIDSESRLQAALAKFTQADPASSEKTTEQHKAATPHNQQQPVDAHSGMEH